jgi:hypothetical protein
VHRGADSAGGGARRAVERWLNYSPCLLDDVFAREAARLASQRVAK